MTVYANGEERHRYLVHEPPRPFSFFSPTIVASFEQGRTFMRCLRITRFLDAEHAVELRNRNLLWLSAAGREQRQIGTIEELERVLSDQFLMPRCRIAQAVTILERLNNQPFFGGARWRDSTED
jgi:arylamine N-acetyltransferase